MHHAGPRLVCRSIRNKERGKVNAKECDGLTVQECHDVTLEPWTLYVPVLAAETLEDVLHEVH
ncbi:hypothetical protein E2C01_043160 [Portunus trituberculatus]|uniref:Uncharacterized protein n=1 Tax=Portunus trituberculatus TaxID=210409 RepID=A0A5B7FPI9_PORTR|nr:hypothetical protein [Portunus trituberculatus]